MLETRNNKDRQMLEPRNNKDKQILTTISRNNEDSLGTSNYNNNLETKNKKKPKVIECVMLNLHPQRMLLIQTLKWQMKPDHVMWIMTLILARTASKLQIIQYNLRVAQLSDEACFK